MTTKVFDEYNTSLLSEKDQIVMFKRSADYQTGVEFSLTLDELKERLGLNWTLESGLLTFPQFNFLKDLF